MDNWLFASVSNRVPAVEMGKRRLIQRNKKPLVLLIVLIVIFLCGLSIVKYKQYQEQNAVCTTDCNVMLISADSIRADHLGAYGYSRATSPNFDKLAKQGTLFKNYYSTTFLTPTSESSVHTGLYPTSSGMTNFYNELPADRTTLAEYMKKLGYSTNAVISSPEFIGNKELKASFERGYDEYKFPNASPKITLGAARKNPPVSEITSVMRKAKTSNNQTFLWLPLGGVHWPFGVNAPKVWTNPNYNGKLSKSDLDINLFMNIYDGYVYPPNSQKVALSTEDKQYIVDNYDDGIRYFDDYLGTIIEQLDKLNLEKKTILIIQSEHGEALGENGYYAHYDIQDNQTHVPLLIVDPRIKGGKQVSSLASSVDILPTILELVGTSADNGIQGKSLVPLLNGKEKDGQRSKVYLERTPLWEEAVILPGQNLEKLSEKITGAKDIAIRTDKWKYILRLSNKREEEVSVWAKLTGKPVTIPPAELYDLINDPREIKNVVNQNPQIAAQLKKQLEDWYAKTESSAPANVKGSNLVQPYQ